MSKHARQGRLTRLDITVLSVAVGLIALLIGLHLNLSQPSSFSGSILYLTPANERRNNIWSAYPDRLDKARQMTFSDTGIQSFAVSPNGKWVVYTEYQNDGATKDTHLILLNVLTFETQPLTSCVDSSCENPIFSPDSRFVAYERINLNSDLPGVPASPPRILLVDLFYPEPREQPLERDEQKLGMTARWSPDGRWLSVLDRSAGGVRLYDMQRGRSTFIARSYTSSGTFSSDSKRLVFPAFVEGNGEVRTILQQYDLDDGSLETLQTDVVGFRPVAAFYSPSGPYLAALHLAEEAQCYSGPALYLARILESGELQTISATDYCVQTVTWGPTGTQLFLQRVFTDETGTSTSEIWMYDPETGVAERLIANAYHPRWLP